MRHKNNEAITRTVPRHSASELLVSLIEIIFTKINMSVSQSVSHLLKLTTILQDWNLKPFVTRMCLIDMFCTFLVQSE
jgi:hypothetical protein